MLQKLPFLDLLPSMYIPLDYELTILMASNRFNEYFKTTSAATRKVVAARLKAVAKEAGSNTATKYYCEDTLG